MIELTKKLYNAALLTRCYVKHFLSLFIDSKVNNKRHFIKIPFINEGMEFIDLHKSVISSVPNYFHNLQKPLSFVINITHLLDLLNLTLIRL